MGDKIHEATLARLQAASADDDDLQSRIQEYVAMDGTEYDGSAGCPLIGEDPDGRPMFAFDVKAFVTHPDSKIFHQCMMKYVERVTNNAKDPMAGHIWVWSASKVGVSDFWSRRKLWQYMMNINERLFPGLLHKMVIYDVNVISRKVVQYIQTYMLKPDIAARFEVHSGKIQTLQVEKPIATEIGPSIGAEEPLAIN